MPRLEHANLVVADIGPTLKLLQAAFPDWRVRGEGEDDWYGKPRRWLHFGDDDFYITLNDNGEGAPRDPAGHAPGVAHIGFEVSRLDDVVARLQAAGFKSHHRGRHHPYRNNAYFFDGEGIEFEFVEYLTDIPPKKNLYL